MMQSEIMMERILLKRNTCSKTIVRHRDRFERLYNAYEKAQNIEEYLESLNSDVDVFTKLPKALPKAIAMGKRNACEQEFVNQTAKNFNPFFGFIPDPDYQWQDSDVITLLYRLGQIMRSDIRKNKML